MTTVDLKIHKGRHSATITPDTNRGKLFVAMEMDTHTTPVTIPNELVDEFVEQVKAFKLEIEVT